MPKIQADFTTVKAGTDFTPLPAQTYHCQIESITAGKTKTQKDKLDFELNVLGSDDNDATLIGRKIFDSITLTTNKGEVNKMALSQIKAYAEAILGEEAANNPTGIDTDDLVNGECMVTVNQHSYEKTEKGPNGETLTGIGNEVKKVSAV